MKLLEQAILERGHAIGTEVLLVDSFLNHQVDVELIQAIGEEFARHFEKKGVNRVATIESSGIAPAAFTALRLRVPLLIMKKHSSCIMTGNLLTTTVVSFTKGKEYQLTAKRDFLPAGDNVLFIDDFLAYGEAAIGAKKLIEQAGANLAGVGIVIEKSFQNGSQRLREAGIDLYSLARIRSIGEDAIRFMED